MNHDIIMTLIVVVLSLGLGNIQARLIDLANITAAVWFARKAGDV